MRGGEKQVGALCFKETRALCREIRARDNRETLPERPDAEPVAVWIIRVQPWMEKEERRGGEGRRG